MHQASYYIALECNNELLAFWKVQTEVLMYICLYKSIPRQIQIAWPLSMAALETLNGSFSDEGQAFWPYWTQKTTPE